MSEKEPAVSASEAAEADGEYQAVYRAWFEWFASQVDPEDQLPVYVAGYRVTPAELRGEVLYWSSQYLSSKRCPPALQTALCRGILHEVAPAAAAEPLLFGFDQEAGVYIPLKLMQAVIERVNGICLRYLDNAKLDALPPPPAPRPAGPLSVSSALKNQRRVMEDRHVEIPNLEALFGLQCEEHTGVYAVYDGHVDGAAATYCAAHLHQYLCESAHYRGDLRRALTDAFLRTDREYVCKSNEQRANGGSTAVVVVVRGNTLLTGWVGDSQALLVKGYTYLPLVYPHRPDRVDERERITALGGQVMFWGTWRVNGQLAVSRAIGDAKYKPYVSGEPEVTAVTLDGGEDYVVIASDGLWDVLSEEDVMMLVYDALLETQDDLKEVPQRLIFRAKREGSGDNISVIVVFLRDPRDIRRDCARMGPGVVSDGRENGSMSAEEAVRGRRRDWETELAAGGAGADEAAIAQLLASSQRRGCGGDAEAPSSESDSEDLGPETAVDGAEEAEADAEIQRMQARECEPPSEPRRDTPTPPAHQVHATGASSALVENVAESGEDSDDEWNYFKGEQKQPRAGSASPPPPADREPPSPPPRAARSPHSPHPRDQDRGAWEEEDSSGDMNSSPLNPDAPVFVPGGAESPLLADRLIAESPRKPLPMDEGELPGERQFASEATARPADIHDLLNGHHTISPLEEKVQLNGGGKLEDGGAGGEGVGVCKGQDLLQDIQRVQRDTTDFCNIQVGYAHTGDVDPVSGDIDEELFERLKSKERDPMSMSFYREKDDDSTEAAVDLNAVRPLPDSDDDDIDTPSDLDNKENYPRPAHTDTPESHKLLFEQIPETPHGKNAKWTAAQSEPAPAALPAFLSAPGRDLDMDLISDFEPTAPPASDFSLDAKFDTVEFGGGNPFAADSRDEGNPDVAFDNFVIESQGVQENVFAQDAGDNFMQDLIKPTCDPISNETYARLEGLVRHFSLEASLREPDIAAHDEIESCDNGIDFDSGLKTEVEPLQEFFKLEEPCAIPTVLTPEPASPAPELTAQSPEPAVMSPELAAPSPAPAALSPEPTAVSPMPVASSPVPTALSPTPVALSPEPVDACMSPSPEPRAVSTDPAVQSPVPVALSPEPVTHSPTPAALSPEPVAKSPVPAAPTPEPVAQSPVPASPEPIVQSPVLISNSPEPTALSPRPAQSPELMAVSPLPPSEPENKHEEIKSSLLESGDAIEELTQQFVSFASTVDSTLAATEIPTEPQIEVKESRAQEICIPVTDEIPSATVPRVTATPPPTPAVDLTAAPFEALIAPATATEVQETLIAADIPAPAEPLEPAAPAVTSVVAAAAGAAAVAAAATATVAAAAKSKTPASTKKTTTTAKTPISPTKPAAKTPTSKATTPALKKTSTPATPRTPASTTKPAAPKAAAPRTSLTKPAPSPATKSSTTTARTTPTAKPAVASARPAAAAAKPPATKPAPINKSAPMLTRAAPAKPAATAPRAASATTARPAPTRAPAARPTSAAPKPKPAAAPKAAEAKPLTNGEVRPPIRRPVPGAVPPPKPAAAAPAAPAAPKPAPRPAPITRPAPRTTAAPALTKTTAPKPAARAPAAAPRPALDKQSKDLANKRLSTAKTAPPRTAPATKGASKPNVKTSVMAGKPREAEKAAPPAVNGTAEVATEERSADTDKPPATPPPVDNSLLPDLVA